MEHPRTGDLAAFAELLPVGIFRTDSRGECLYVNQRWCEISGLTAAASRGLGWINAIHPADCAKVKNDWQRAAAAGQNLRSEYRVQDPAGKITWVVGEAVAERSPEGKLTGYIGTVTDITEQKLAEAALRVNEARFRSAFGFAPHGMALTAPDGRFLQVNRLLCRMLRYSEAELLQLRFQGVTHPDELPASAAGAKQLLEGSLQVFETEKRYLRKDGSEIWVSLRTNLLRDTAGQPLYFLSHIQEIGERKRAETALHESEERYRRLVELSPDGILIHSDGKVVFVNPAAAKIMGASSRKQMLNKDVLDLVHPDFRPVVQRRMRELREGATFEPFLREKLIKLDGSELHVEAAAVPFVYKGQPAIQVIFRDISEAIHAEEERDRLFRQVEAARDELRCLSQSLVEVQELERRRIARELHDEIGQELTALRLNIEQTSNGSQAAVQSSCREAQDRVNRLLGLVRNLSLDLRPTMLDDLGLVPALIWHCDRYSALSETKVHFKHCGLENRRFSAEIETAAYRIIQEALTNALRYSSAQHVNVTLWTSEENPMLQIQVEDCGKGFDVEAAFQRGRSSGLSSMRERAVLLGGRVLIESIQDKGTCVTAQLPLQPASHPPSPDYEH